MGMIFKQYNSGEELISNEIGYDSVDARETNDSMAVERTEELPEQREDGEIKKTFRERGGIPYVHNASFLGSQEFAVMPTTGGKILSLKNQDSKVGLYSVDEDGNNKTVIEEDGTMPRVEEIYQEFLVFKEQTELTLQALTDSINDINDALSDIGDRLVVLETPTP